MCFWKICRRNHIQKASIIIGKTNTHTIYSMTTDGLCQLLSVYFNTLWLELTDDIIHFKSPSRDAVGISVHGDMKMI